MTSDPVPAAEGWRIYLHRRVLAMLVLGFSAGLPFPLVPATLAAGSRRPAAARATSVCSPGHAFRPPGRRSPITRRRS